MNLTKPPLDIREEIKELKFSVKGDVSSSCHDTTDDMLVVTDNLIRFPFARAMAQNCIVLLLEREAALPVKPSFFSVPGLWRQSAQMQNNCLLQDCSDKHK